MSCPHGSNVCTPAKPCVLCAAARRPPKQIEDDSGPVPGPQLPMPAARHYIHTAHTPDNTPTLLHWQDTFHVWDDGHWHPLDDRVLRSDIYARFEHATYLNGKGEPARWTPNRHKVGDLLDAAAAITNLPSTVPERTFIRHDGTHWHAVQPNAASTRVEDVIALQDGLLHIPTRELHPLSPTLFVLSRLRVHWNGPRANPFHAFHDTDNTTRNWLAFLDALWPNDPQSISLLQEWFGYVISGDLRQQKMLLIIGPRRGGKGTIARILTALVGDENVAAPTLPGIGGNFGLSSLIGKPLAIIFDARFSGRDTDQVVERLLRISGEDYIDIDRKHKPIWTGRLGTRLMLLANETPRLGDASGAVASRFLPLRLTGSWLGREDHTLFEKLAGELRGILEWSLDGLDRLRARGHFVVPDSSAEIVDELEDLSSPAAIFVRDRCVLDPARITDVDTLYEGWRDWCKHNGWERIPTRQIFGRDLRAAFPTIRRTQPRDGEHRVRAYQGIGLVDRPCCGVCGRPLDPVLAAGGLTEHPGCGAPSPNGQSDPNTFAGQNEPLTY